MTFYNNVFQSKEPKGVKNIDTNVLIQVELTVILQQFCLNISQLSPVVSFKPLLRTFSFFLCLDPLLFGFPKMPKPAPVKFV